jgi:hypothetical protein
VVSVTPRPLYPREKPGTHCTGDWVGPRAGLDRCGKSRHTGIRSPDCPPRSQLLYRLNYRTHGDDKYDEELEQTKRQSVGPIAWGGQYRIYRIPPLNRWKIEMCPRDPMLQHFNKFMRLNADNSFTLRVFLNCVYLLYCATC